MKENWRTTLPLPKLAVGFVFAYLATYLLDFVASYLGAGTQNEIREMRMAVIVVFAALHGGLRVILSHPFYDPGYRKWLSVSPWHAGQPLPKGPVHLIWTDVVLLGVLCLLAYSNDLTRASVPAVVFLAAYLLLLNLTFAPGHLTFLLAALFLAPLTFYPHEDVSIAGFVLVGLYVLARVGLHHYFRRFPWNTDYWNIDLIEELRRNALEQNIIGWPFRPLRVFESIDVTMPVALMLSLLLTWWAYAVILTEKSAFVVLVPLVVLPVLLRGLAYMLVYRPPISLLGRIATGRLIIPRYDKVFIAPICTLLASTVLPLALSFLGLNKEHVLGISCFIVLFLTFAMPPRMKDWQLTGAHRIVNLPQSARQRVPGPKTERVNAIVSQMFRPAR